MNQPTFMCGKLHSENHVNWPGLMDGNKNAFKKKPFCKKKNTFDEQDEQLDYSYVVCFFLMGITRMLQHDGAVPFALYHLFGALYRRNIFGMQRLGIDGVTKTSTEQILTNFSYCEFLHQECSKKPASDNFLIFLSEYAHTVCQMNILFLNALDIRGNHKIDWTWIE